MATLQTTNDFRDAIRYLQSIDHFGSVILQVNVGDTVAECEVLDDDTLTDITPDTVTLEAALDSANAEISESETKAIARTLMLSDAKNYLSNQLQSASPNVQTIFNTVKAYVDNNPTLTQMLTNQIALFNVAYGVTINPSGATAADRTRYLICCQLVLATIA